MLGRAVFPLAALMVAAASLVVGPAPHRSPSPRDLLERARLEEREARDRLEGRLRAEPRDPARSSRVERDLRSALVTLGRHEERAVRTVDCGSTTCRIELRLERPDPEIGTVLPSLGWRGTASFFEDPQDPRRLTLFLEQGRP